MAIYRRIELVAFDIGGVLASIDKAPLNELLRLHGVDDSLFFDDNFVKLQKGMISTTAFLAHQKRSNTISPRELAYASQRMLTCPHAAMVLRALPIPYIFASNINRFHFKCFINQTKPTDFSLKSSVLSFRLNCFKPDLQFFEAIGAGLGVKKSAILFIDDDVINVRHAQRIGLTSRLCPSPNQLVTTLRSWGLLDSDRLEL